MKTDLVRKDGNAYLKLRGAVTEDDTEAFAKLLTKLKKSHVVIDLGEVESINSVGFRQWLSFAKQLHESCTFELNRCPPCFMEFVNLLPNLSFSKNIVSVQVPYRCTSCAAETNPTYEVDVLTSETEFEPLICNECNGVTRAREERSGYLAFRNLDEVS